MSKQQAAFHSFFTKPGTAVAEAPKKEVVEPKVAPKVEVDTKRKRETTTDSPRGTCQFQQLFSTP